MMHFAPIFLAVTLVTGCAHSTSEPQTLNTVENIESEQVIYEGEPWIELTITQRLNRKSPAYIVGIRENKWANHLRWEVVRQTMGYDKVTSCFRIQPIGETKEITLKRDDFEWFPYINGFPPITVTRKEAEPDPATHSQPIHQNGRR